MNISTKEVLSRAIQTSFASERAIVTGSGKEAIFLIAEAFKDKKQLQNPVCNVAAYTCPDVASALVKAGFKIRLFDISAIDLRPKAIEAETNEVVLYSNLFGLPDEISETGAFVIDDACQSGLSYFQGHRVGSRGDAGVLSFGRGKAFPGPGGGAILLNSDLEIQDLPAVSRKHLFSQATKMALLWLLQRPWLYRVPVSLPFLHLGHTEFTGEFEREPSRRGASLSAFVQLGNSKNRSKVFLDNSKKWSSYLSGMDLIDVYKQREFSDSDSVIPIRYPLIFPNEKTRDVAWRELQLAGLGASSSYPGTLSEYPQLEGHIIAGRDSESKTVSERILTLPVHRYVKECDMERTAKIIKSIL